MPASWSLIQIYSLHLSFTSVHHIDAILLYLPLKSTTFRPNASTSAPVSFFLSCFVSEVISFSFTCVPSLSPWTVSPLSEIKVVSCTQPRRSSHGGHFCNPPTSCDLNLVSLAGDR